MTGNLGEYILNIFFLIFENKVKSHFLIFFYFHISILHLMNCFPVNKGYLEEILFS